MDKKRRQQLKMTKYKKRLKILRIKNSADGNYYTLRSHGKPCSCSFCRNKKYRSSRSKNKEV